MKTFNKVLALSLSLLVAILPIAQTSADVLSTTFYHNDALGSPVAATDENGNVKWREQYKPYGEKVINELEAIDNSRWYTGHPHDEETGLTYAGARYYDPVIGRFMGIDPVGAAAAADNPMMFNRYAYGNNNPYKYVDPDGEFAILGFIPWLFGAGGTATTTTVVSFTATEVAVGVVAGTAIAGTATVLMNESSDEDSSGDEKTRFIGEPNGVVVDTDSTPRGSYDQPDGSRTDVLQGEDHGAGHSHTHRPKYNTNPATGERFVNGMDGGNPVSEQEVSNIVSGKATKSPSKRR